MRADVDHDAVSQSQARHQVVVAPPGTGKTFLAIRLAGERIEELPPHSQVLVLTFSNQARTQLELEASRQLSPQARRRVEVTNYHRFFWHAVQAYRQALGLPLEVDLVSRKQRIKALQAQNAAAVKDLKGETGLLECLAEQAYSEFRDERTPKPEVVDELLQVVRLEQQGGRLLFDDFGALFWELLTHFPTVDAAYGLRYPIVIADEHQDASALQDAVVRRLGTDRLTIFADPMQLIHRFRGASPERLEKHLSECGDAQELSTPHRWYGDDEVGEWLLAVRRRLQGETVTANRPGSVDIVSSPSAHGFNGVLNPTKAAVSAALKSNHQLVAVLAWRNDEIAKVRSYLTKAGFYPRQLGGADDFEEAREVIEQLPLLNDPETLARQALARIAAFVPALPPAVVKQIEGRLGPKGVKLAGCSDRAEPLLRALAPLYSEGPGYFFQSVIGGLEACSEAGLHMPRLEAVRAFRDTAAAVEGAYDLDLALREYRDRVAASTHTAPSPTKGVYVMTAHQAKGKEFDAVVLVNATADDFPDTAEGRRLFYVAITRASRRWTVIAPKGKETPLLSHL